MLHARASVLTTDRDAAPYQSASPISTSKGVERLQHALYNAYNTLFMVLRRSGPQPTRPSVEPVENLIDHPARMLDVLGAPLDLDEAALLEHADRADVARGDPRVERPLGDLGRELCERGSRQSAAPELAPDPVADQPQPVLHPAPDVPGRRAVGDDRPLHERFVGQQAPPVRVERLAVTRREDRHRRTLRVGLVLEERVEVAGLDVTEYPHDA